MVISTSLERLLGCKQEKVTESNLVNRVDCRAVSQFPLPGSAEPVCTWGHLRCHE